MVYGSLGLCGELAFTATHELLKGRRPRGHTSMWMFPIYGLVQPLFEPVHAAMRGRVPAPARAVVYAAGFMSVEYVSGRLLRAATGEMPWDYSHARLSLGQGLTRLDYAPFWAVAGLALEAVHDSLSGVRPVLSGS